MVTTWTQADVPELYRATGLSPFRSGGDAPIVALDIDGTLGDYHSHFLWFAEQWLGMPMPSASDLNPGLRLSDFMGIPHELYRQCKLAYRQGGLKRWMPCFDYAPELTVKIREAGAQVWICTTRPYMRLDNIDPDTREWLRRNHIEYDAVIFEGVLEGGNPATKYQDLVSQVGAGRIVAAIDDLPEQVDDAYKRGIRKVYIRDQPYNRAAIDGSDLYHAPAIRVKTLMDLWWGHLALDIDYWKEGIR